MITYNNGYAEAANDILDWKCYDTIIYLYIIDDLWY